MLGFSVPRGVDPTEHMQLVSSARPTMLTNQGQTQLQMQPLTTPVSLWQQQLQLAPAQVAQMQPGQVPPMPVGPVQATQLQASVQAPAQPPVQPPVQPSAQPPVKPPVQAQVVCTVPHPFLNLPTAAGAMRMPANAPFSPPVYGSGLQLPVGITPPPSVGTNAADATQAVLQAPEGAPMGTNRKMATLASPASSTIGHTVMVSGGGQRGGGGSSSLSALAGAPKPARQPRAPPSKIDKQGWTREEDIAILQHVNIYGQKWSIIADGLPGRTDDAVRNRFIRLQRKMFMQGHSTRGGDMWTPEEDAHIQKAVSTLGPRWQAIAELLPGRSPNAVRNRHLRVVEVLSATGSSPPAVAVVGMAAAAAARPAAGTAAGTATSTFDAATPAGV